MLVRTTPDRRERLENLDFECRQELGISGLKYKAYFVTRKILL